MVIIYKKLKEYLKLLEDSYIVDLLYSKNIDNLDDWYMEDNNNDITFTYKIDECLFITAKVRGKYLDWFTSEISIEDENEKDRYWGDELDLANFLDIYIEEKDNK